MIVIGFVKFVTYLVAHPSEVIEVVLIEMVVDRIFPYPFFGSRIFGEELARVSFQCLFVLLNSGVFVIDRNLNHFVGR